jgi:hypothetical protein
MSWDHANPDPSRDGAVEHEQSLEGHGTPPLLHGSPGWRTGSPPPAAFTSSAVSPSITRRSRVLRVSSSSALSPRAANWLPAIDSAASCSRSACARGVSRIRVRACREGAAHGGPGRGRLDGHHPAQLTLGLTVPGVEKQQDRPLGRCHSMALQPPRERLRHQSGGAVDEVPEVVVDGVDSRWPFLRAGAGISAAWAARRPGRRVARRSGLLEQPDPVAPGIQQHGHPSPSPRSAWGRGITLPPPAARPAPDTPPAQQVAEKRARASRSPPAISNHTTGAAISYLPVDTLPSPGRAWTATASCQGLSVRWWTSLRPGRRAARQGCGTSHCQTDSAVTLRRPTRGGFAAHIDLSVPQGG